MSKRFVIPLVNLHFTIYCGPEEWRTWYLACKKNGCTNFRGDDVNSPPDVGGRCWYGWLWVASTEDVTTVFHEVTHLLARLYEQMNCGTEEEFKAVLSGHVLSIVHEWLVKVNQK